MSEIEPRPHAPVPAIWDAEHERDVDRRIERSLLVRELLVIAVIAGLVVLRLIFAPGG